MVGIKLKISKRSLCPFLIRLSFELRVWVSYISKNAVKFRQLER